MKGYFGGRCDVGQIVGWGSEVRRTLVYLGIFSGKLESGLWIIYII